MLRGGNRGEAGDAFGAHGPVSFTNSTNPSTRRNSGALSTVTFYRIQVVGDSARLTLSTETISLDRLLAAFVGTGAPPLNSAEGAYLDTVVGNGNGRYDIGDLRAYLKR